MSDDLVIHGSFRDDISAPVARVRAELLATRKELDGVGKGGGGAGSGLDKTSGSAEKLRKQIGSLNSSLKDASEWLGNKMRTGARDAGLALLALGTIITGFAVKSTSDFQQTQTAFSTLLGSAQQGQALFKQIAQFKFQTPFSVSQLTDATDQLLHFGVAGDQVTRVLKGMSDIAATAKDPAASLNALTSALGQIMSEGIVTQQSARQLIAAGLNPYEAFSQSLGLSSAQVKQLVGQGKLTSDTLVNAIAGETGGFSRFAGGAQAAATQTLGGMWSNLKASMQLGLADALKPLTAQLGAEMPQITAGVSGFLGAVGPGVFKIVGDLLTLLTHALPIVEPPIEAILNGLDLLLTTGGPALNVLQPLGGELGSAITELFRQLAPEMPLVVHLLGQVILILPDFVRLLGDLIPVVDPMLRLIDGMLQFDGVRQVMAGLLLVLLGYKTLSSIADGLYKFSNGLVSIGNAGTRVNAARGVAAPGASGPSGGTIAGFGLGLVGATSLASTAGPVTSGKSSIGEDLQFVGGGAALGAGIGSFVPGVGTAAGALIGGILAGGYDLSSHLFGDVAGNATRTAARSNRALAMAGGGRITSLVRGFGTYPGSGHRDGTASDLVAASLPRLAASVKSLGGYPVHEGGHIHAQWGDSPVPAFSSSWGRGPAGSSYQFVFPNATFSNDLDVQREFRKAMEAVERDRADRDRQARQY